MAKIKRVSAEKKIEIVKAHLLEKKPVSELSEAHGISPKNIYLWQNQLFSNGALVFERKNDRRTGENAAKRSESRINELEDKLRQKNEIISELMEELLKGKKLVGGI